MARSAPGDGTRRRVGLPGGGELVVRPVGPDDAAALVSMYDRLSDDDRYRRFFSGFRPDLAFCERAARVGERGGYGLVAVAVEPAAATARSVAPRPGRVVGEASYELLPNGNGELGMTVVPDSRGWLGPYLLDALVEAARERGVPNIEADVLVTNRPMLEMLRARGYAVAPSTDWVSMRLVIGTAGATPTWPEAHDRPRVLVEAPGGRWHAGGDAVEAGLDVIACSGPRGPRTRCPVLAGRPCPLVEGADVVVVSHPPDDPRWHDLVEGHGHLHPGVPICIETSAAGSSTGIATDGTAPGGSRGPAVARPEDHDRVVAIVSRLVAGDDAGGDPRGDPRDDHRGG